MQKVGRRGRKGWRDGPEVKKIVRGKVENEIFKVNNELTME